MLQSYELSKFLPLEYTTSICEIQYWNSIRISTVYSHVLPKSIRVICEANYLCVNILSNILHSVKIKTISLMRKKGKNCFAHAKTDWLSHQIIHLIKIVWYGDFWYCYSKRWSDQDWACLSDVRTGLETPLLWNFQIPKDCYSATATSQCAFKNKVKGTLV